MTFGASQGAKHLPTPIFGKFPHKPWATNGKRTSAPVLFLLFSLPVGLADLWAKAIGLSQARQQKNCHIVPKTMPTHRRIMGQGAPGLRGRCHHEHPGTGARRIFGKMTLAQSG